MITRAEVLRGQVCPDALNGQLDMLLTALNKLRAAYSKPMRVTSGYRTFKHNAEIGGAPNSLHMQGLACDFADKDRELANWCLANLPELEKAKLWLEDPSHTPGWVHLQAAPPKSGKRVFKP